MKRKLLKTRHYINIYRDSDKDIEKEIYLDVPFERIINIVPPKEDDPLLYDGYVLNKRQMDELLKLINEEIDIDFEKYYYVLECEGIYE